MCAGHLALSERAFAKRVGFSTRKEDIKLLTTPIGMRFMPVSPLTLKAKLVSILFSSIKFFKYFFMFCETTSATLEEGKETNQMYAGHLALSERAFAKRVGFSTRKEDIKGNYDY
jgi:NAD/NADP transhydrogenase alpha subunit